MWRQKQPDVGEHGPLGRGAGLGGAAKSLKEAGMDGQAQGRLGKTRAHGPRGEASTQLKIFIFVNVHHRAIGEEGALTS